MKKEYKQPKVEVTLIYTEEGVAAGSARVDPRNQNGFMEEQWIQEDDDNRNIDW